MKRNKFSLSHYKLLTCNMGELIPISWYEVLPGDTMQHRTNCLLRLSPLLAPVMHPVKVRIHHWFVPYRHIWDDWEDFITGGEDGLDSTGWPYVEVTNALQGTLRDYMGVPVKGTAYSPALQVSALPFRAYHRIYNDHYRDQQLVSEQNISTGNGADATTPHAASGIHKVSWEKDYFTTARPYEQLGSEVTIPLVGDAPVFVTGGDNTAVGIDSPKGSGPYQMDTQGAAGDPVLVDTGTAATYQMMADLSAATGMSINDLRLYIAAQRYKENRNEFGSRYVEYLRSLGVRSSDARLQNPEYLGGGRQVVQFSEVLSTADSGTDVVGTLRGHGIAAMRTSRYRRFFDEHGICMSLLSVVPKAIYSNGLHRSFYKTSKEDYYQKEFAHIGDQAVLNREVFAEHATPDGTFGYQARYDEYRYHPSMIHAEFTGSLNHWHYARVFGSTPALNQSFIDCEPTKRQYADNSSDVLYVMANHSIQARRMIPKWPRKGRVI